MVPSRAPQLFAIQLLNRTRLATVRSLSSSSIARCLLPFSSSSSSSSFARTPLTSSSSSYLSSSFCRTFHATASTRAGHGPPDFNTPTSDYLERSEVEKRVLKVLNNIINFKRDNALQFHGDETSSSSSSSSPPSPAVSAVTSAIDASSSPAPSSRPYPANLQASLTATFASLGFDSLDQVEVMLQLEEEFVIDLYDPLAASIVTVEDAVNVITDHPFAM